MNFTDLTIQSFSQQAVPAIDALKILSTKLEQDLRNLVVFYGEDPAAVKAEDVFGLVVTFSAALQVGSDALWHDERNVLTLATDSAGARRSQNFRCENKTVQSAKVRNSRETANACIGVVRSLANGYGALLRRPKLDRARRFRRRD